jgi:endonuclease-3
VEPTYPKSLKNTTKKEINSMTKKQRAEIIIKTLKKLYPKLEKFLDSSNDHEFLFAVILSAQTTDKNVNKVTPKLFDHFPSLKHYADATPKQIQEFIQQINYYRAKSKYIHETAKILLDQNNGIIPNTLSEILSLPGVGRKTANVVLGNIYGISEGIAVDTHVVRLAQKYELSQHSDPKKIEQDLMKLLPKEEWFDFTNRIIAYGREYCPARNHDHNNCPLYKAIFTK